MFRETVIGILTIVMATHANGQVSSSLAPLSEAEQGRLVDAYVIHRVCQPHIDNKSQIYARELLFKAGQANPAVTDYFKGIEDALLERPELFNITTSWCAKELPAAFKDLELFKRIIDK